MRDNQRTIASAHEKSFNESSYCSIDRTVVISTENWIDAERVRGTLENLRALEIQPNPQY